MELNLESNTQRFITSSKKQECALIAVLNSLEEMQQEFGLAKNATLRLLEQPMTSNFSSKIIVDAKEKTRAIFDSINIDNEFYPENPTKTSMKLQEKIIISIESEHISHLRANLNSTLRLIQASYDAIESVDDP